ncbi:MAG TPA: thioredoxin domain-containing protein [Candidatus Obscuribacterales bacterium]
MMSWKQGLAFVFLMLAVILPFAIYQENASLNAHMVEVNETNFDREVMASTIPVFVDVTARDCSSVACTEHRRLVAQLAREYLGKVKFVRIYVDDFPEAVTLFSVSRVPEEVIVIADQTGSLKELAHADGSSHKAALRIHLNQAMMSTRAER